MLCIAAGLLFSCEKDELTQPVQIYFRMKLDKTVEQHQPVSFQEGMIDIESIEFTGDRVTGEDITFTSDFETIVSVDLSTGNTDPIVKFDVPQGTYKKITISVNPVEIEPDISVRGKFIPPLLGPAIPIQLDVNIPGQLNLLVKTASGESQIVLTKGKDATIEVFLNPSSWFTEIPATALLAADLQNIGGIPSIVISKNSNPDMYFKLTSAIEASAEAILK